MRVKTFLTIGKEELDKVVNEWMEKHKNIIIVYPPSTSFVKVEDSISLVFYFSMTIYYNTLESV